MGCQGSKSATVEKDSEATAKNLNQDSPPFEGHASDESSPKIVNSTTVGTPSEQTKRPTPSEDIQHNKIKQTGIIGATHKVPEVAIEDQIQQLPQSTKDNDIVASDPSDVNIASEDQWHDSIKVDQLAMKLQFLTSEWAETKENVRCDE